MNLHNLTTNGTPAMDANDMTNAMPNSALPGSMVSST
jgi:hypothetical protein